MCRRVGLELVGLNAPGHLLLAPADPLQLFVIDPFHGGKLLSEADAAAFIAARGAPDGLARLHELRAVPMTPCAWCARLLRNLRQVHMAANDAVRLLGASERLLMLSMADTVSTDTERARCALDMLKCLCELRWSERRLEAREMLLKLLRQGEAGGLQSAEQTQLSALLRVSWFHAGNSCSSR